MVDITTFTKQLPLPELSPLQRQIAGEILSIEGLADTRTAQTTGADREIYGAVRALATALDAAAVERDEDDCRVHPYDEEGWKPWEAAERWILRDGYTTGSARVLAICYLAKTLGLKLKWREVYAGTLDTARASLATDMIKAHKPAGLPLRFWRIYTSYRESLVRELELQNWKGWV